MTKQSRQMACVCVFIFWVVVAVSHGIGLISVGMISVNHNIAFSKNKNTELGT